MRKKSPLFSAMILASLLVGGILSSCDGDAMPIDEVEGIEVPEIETTTYNIAFAETNGVEAALSKTVAEAGDEIEITIESIPEGYEIESITADVESVNIITESSTLYTFIMPESDVNLTIDVVEIIDEPTEYSLTITYNETLNVNRFSISVVNADDYSDVNSDNDWTDDPYDPTVVNKTWNNLIAENEYLILIDGSVEILYLYSATASVTKGDTTLEVIDNLAWSFAMPNEDVEIALTFTEIEEYSLTVYNDVPLEGNVLFLLDTETNIEIEGDFQYDDSENATSMTKTWEDLRGGNEYIIYIDLEEYFWEEYEVTGSVTSENTTLEKVDVDTWKFVMPNEDVKITLSWTSLD